jgi:outer membrane receptor protein involved in Fe transport
MKILAQIFLFCVLVSFDSRADSKIDLSELSLEQLMEIPVTSVSKSAESQKQSPANVKVISGDEIRKFGYRTLSEVLARVPGFYITNDRNYEYLGVRGLSRPGDYNTRILLLINGHRINDPIYDYAPIAEEFPADIQDIDRIEIVKGPGSSLWGTNALLGVINVVTKSGQNIDGASVTAEYGSLNRTKGHLEVGKKYESGLDIAASFATLNSNGDKNIFFPEFTNDTFSGGFAMDQDEEVAQRGSVRMSWKDINIEYFQKGRDKTIPTGSYGSLFNSDQNTTDDKSSHLEINTTRQLSDSIDLVVRGYRDEVSYGGLLTIPDGKDIFINRDFSQSTILGTEARLIFDISDDVKLITGLEYQDQSPLSFFNENTGTNEEPFLDLESSRTLLSIYSQLEYEPLEQLKFVFGLRKDDYSNFDSEISPRTAVIYSPLESTNIKLMAGRAFRIPNFYETNYSAGTVLPNSSLSPERLYSYELLVEQSINKDHFLSLSYFDLDLRDIVTQTSNSMSQLQFANRGSASSQGIEFGYDGRLRSDYSIFANATVLTTKDSSSGSSLSNAPALLANIGLSATLFNSGWNFSPNWQFIGARNTLDDSTADHKSILNLNFTRNDILDGLDLSFGIYDLFDSAFFDPGAEEHVQDVLPQNGRTWRGQLIYRF